ncbi:MAG TPA: hypothetical protein VFF73_02565, partial [Planctomycetota bacterium]|nr:hypothetical protein [Planctomycetota bacterium]
MAHAVQEDAQDPRARRFESGLELGLGSPLSLGDRRNGEHDRSVGEVVTIRERRDSVQDHGPSHVDHGLVVVRVELALSEAATGREATEGVRKPLGDAREVV